MNAMRVSCWLLAGVALIALAGPAAAKPCDIDVVPAATLLIPYFEVDAASLIPPTSPADVTTAFAVINSDSKPHIVHVTLWTDWAIPTATFDLHLSALDEQSVNVYDVFRGVVPVTPSALCSAALQPGTLRFSDLLNFDGAANLERLRKAHSGEQFSTGPGPRVASSAHPASVIGYITVDVVNGCTTMNPSSPTYFRNKGRGIATNDNALIGDWFLTDLKGGAAFGEPAVHVRADAAFGGKATFAESAVGDAGLDGKKPQPPPYTFYARYVEGSGRDNRQPLTLKSATRYWVEHVDAQPETELIVWRDTKVPVEGLEIAGEKPSWHPLKLASDAIQDCDEDHHCGSLVATDPMPLATQRLVMGPGEVLDPRSYAGWLRIDVSYPGPAGSPQVLRSTANQSWIVTEMGAHLEGGYAAIGLRSVRLSSSCKP